MILTRRPQSVMLVVVALGLYMCVCGGVFSSMPCALLMGPASACPHGGWGPRVGVIGTLGTCYTCTLGALKRRQSHTRWGGRGELGRCSALHSCTLYTKVTA